MFERGVVSRDDGDNDLLRRLSAKDDLRGEAGTQTTIAWKRLVDEALEHTALAGRLIADDHNLRQRDEGANATGKKLVDFLEHLWLGQAILLWALTGHFFVQGVE